MFSFSNLYRRISGDVVQAVDLNSATENTDYLKVRKPELGLIDVADYPNGFQEVICKIVPTQLLTAPTQSGAHITHTFIEETITFPTTSTLNDGLFKINDFDDLSNIMIIPSIEITDVTLYTGYDNSVGRSFTASIINKTLLGCTVQICLIESWATDAGFASNSIYIDYEVYLRVIGSY